MPKFNIGIDDSNEKEVKKKLPFYKRKWFIALVVIFLIGSCSSLLNDEDEQSKKTETKTETIASEMESKKEGVSEEEVSEEEDISSLTPEERIKEYAKEVFQEDLIEIKNHTGNESLGRIVLITKFSEGALTGNLEVKSFLMKASSYLEKIKDEDFESVFLGLEADFVDAYGNTSPSNAVKMEINKEDVDKINFENFDYNKLPVIAETFDVHPGVGYKGN